MTLTRSARPAAREVVARLLRPLRLDLHRQQHAVRRQRAGEPDARVADRGADLEDARGADGRRQHAQQRADFGVDERQAARLVRRARCRRAPRSPERLSPRGSARSASGTIRPIRGYSSDANMRCAHEDHRDRRPRQRFRRDARRADRRRHRHLPAEFFARHARVAGARRSRACARRRRAPAARSRSCRISAGRRSAPAGSKGGRPLHGEARRHACGSRPATSSARPGRHVDDVRGPRAERACPAIGCCSPTARSSCASTPPTAPRFRRRSSKAASSASTRGSTRRACRCRRRRSRRRTSTI